ncbi:conserved hypothetical protein [Desulfomicrobium baculatum DSM 4028]|uniref:Secreted protein n=1 Tax=Desulfomicrobium baculatum (strain DSM 4028 / VKM B-1378 / X) TaxID=525897 RepID=C7LNH3_DESBD|nr:conserved hypothetical protein [Desulfomicrobium baculatum DSM 4028]
MTLFTKTLVFLFITALPAHAGQVTKTHADDRNRNSSLNFESVFESYQPYRHQPVAPWQQSNKRVGEVGGWRTYAREAAESEGAETAPRSGPDASQPAHDHGSAP